MVYFSVFVFGTIIGSFLNVVALRYGTGQSIVSKSSHCFSCGKKLFWPELIPIISFFIQKGRCIKCKSRIFWQYPVVEMMTGTIFVLIFNKIFSFNLGIFDFIGNWELEIGNFALVIYYWLIFSLLIAISIYDFRHQIIPNGLVYAFVILSLFSVFFEIGYGNLIENWSLEIANVDVAIRFLAGLVFFLCFGLLWFLSRGKWMGFGDAKLAIGIGWLMGLSKGLIALLFSFWIGSIVGIFLLLFSPKNFTMKSRIPFGPFLCLGMLLAFLWGDEILRIYWAFLTI